MVHLTELTLPSAIAGVYDGEYVNEPCSDPIPKT